MNDTAVTPPKDQVIDLAGRAPRAARQYPATHGDGRPLALCLHLHGGAFVGGGLDQGRSVASLLAAAGAAVLSLDYPLAPQHPFPCAAESAHAALAWMQRHRRRLGGGADVPLVIAGEEAGGNLAAAVALMARDRAGPALAGQILLSPMLDLCVASASWRDALTNDAGRCPWADGWRAYLPRACDTVHPYAAPGRSMRLAGLPPTLVVTARDDPLRDEALAYAQRLRRAEVTVTRAVLREATGWPGSYLQHAPTALAAPWAEALRRHLHRFLHERQALFTATHRAVASGVVDQDSQGF